MDESKEGFDVTRANQEARSVGERVRELRERDHRRHLPWGIEQTTDKNSVAKVIRLKTAPFKGR